MRYPKPGPVGGKLIRKVIKLLKEHEVQLPINTHILIALSSGQDSTALAHLLTHFGRKVAEPSRISFLHINHRWRGVESDADEAFVKSLGKKWNVPVITKRLRAPGSHSKGESLEEEARKARKEIFKKLAFQKQAVILTAHHSDDVAETVLWRFMTGMISTHGGGIRVHHGNEIRPLLGIRKSELKDYLVEVGQDFREDQTNFSDRFLRARMRSSLMPEVERIFPRAIETMTALALQSQRGKGSIKLSAKSTVMENVAEIIMGKAGLKLKKAHFDVISEKSVANKNWYGEIHLPDGWKLIRMKQKKEK